MRRRVTVVILGICLSVDLCCPSVVLTESSLVPRPYPVFQCCTLKNGRAWYAKSRVLRHAARGFNVRGRPQPRAHVIRAASTCCMPRFTRELKRRCTDGYQTLQPLNRSVSLFLGPSTGAGYPLVNA